MNLWVVLAEAMVLAAAVSLDAFVASFAYGSQGIRIPFSSMAVLDLVCSGVLGISLVLGTVLRQYLPGTLTTGISAVLLLFLGVVKLLDSMTKAWIRKHGSLYREMDFSAFNLRFVLRVYADPEAADVDASKVISVKEAVSLAVALSLDGMAVGFGAALGSVNVMAVLFSSLVVNAAAVLLGTSIGNRAAKSLPFDFSWLSGVLLMLLAVSKIL